MTKVTSAFVLTLLAFAAISPSSAQTNIYGQLHCNAAYGALYGASNNLQNAARNIENHQANVDRQYAFYEIRMAQFDQQLAQINANEQAARANNRGNTGACVVNNFVGGFFGYGGPRIGGCVAAPINNSIFISVNANNQRNNLKYQKEAWLRGWISQQQRNLKNVQTSVAFFNVQKQKCYAAQSNAENCFLFINQPQPQYPSYATCDWGVSNPQSF